MVIYASARESLSQQGMGKEREFEIGSWVVYPSHGVGYIRDLEKLEVAGTAVEFFVISFKNSNLVLKLPTTKAITTGLRRIASAEEMENAFAVLSKKGRKKKQMWSKRAQEYEEKINSGDPVAMAEVLRDLYRESDDIGQSFSERQIYQEALSRFATELSILYEISEEEAVKKLDTLLAAA